MKILKDGAYCVDYTGSKWSGPERLADVQERHPGATYYANPSEEVVYGEHILYNENVYCGWIACVYEVRNGLR